MGVRGKTRPAGCERGELARSRTGLPTDADIAPTAHHPRILPAWPTKKRSACGSDRAVSCLTEHTGPLDADLEPLSPLALARWPCGSRPSLCGSTRPTDTCLSSRGRSQRRVERSEAHSQEVSPQPTPAGPEEEGREGEPSSTSAPAVTPACPAPHRLMGHSPGLQITR